MLSPERAPENRPEERSAVSGVPPHPGAILYADFLIPLGITETTLARHLGRSVNAINDLVCQRSSLSPDMAILLAATFRTTPEYWLDLRSQREIWERRGRALPAPLVNEARARLPVPAEPAQTQRHRRD